MQEPASRNQIGILLPLIETSSTIFQKIWQSWRRDLNPRPSDYKSDALPTELRQHGANRGNITEGYANCKVALWKTCANFTHSVATALFDTMLETLVYTFRSQMGMFPSAGDIARKILSTPCVQLCTANFAEFAAGHIVDESAHGYLLGYPGMRPKLFQLMPHVFFDVLESKEKRGGDGRRA